MTRAWASRTDEDISAAAPAGAFPDARERRHSTQSTISKNSDSRRRAGIEVNRFASWEDCGPLLPDWARILRDTPKLTIFSTPEWLVSWWKAFGQNKRLVGLSLSNASGDLVGLAPFYQENRCFGRARLLRLVGDGSTDSDNLDLVFRSGYEQDCADALLGELQSQRGWDICELNTLDTDSPVAQAMLWSLKERGWPTVVSQQPRAALALPANWENYLRQLSSEQSKGIARYTRRLERHYSVKIYKCTEEDQLQPALETLFDLHQKRWHTQGQPGSFANPQRKHFYYEMGRSFLRRGWLELWVLELNGKAAAVQFAFRYRDTVYQLQEGLDPQHYSDRAGMVLRAHVLRQLISEGLRRYDFLGGVEQHKLAWGAVPGTYTDVHFAKPSSVGSIQLRLRQRTRRTKNWLRPHIPAPVLRAFRQRDSRA